MVAGGWHRAALPVVAFGVLVAVFLAAGAVGLLVGGLVIASAGRLIRQAVATRRRRGELVDIVAALRMFARELRSGVDPAVAAARVAAATRCAGAATLGALAQLISAGDRAASSNPAGLAGPATTAPGPYTLSRLTGAWRLTARYGVALAPMVEALAGDLAGQLAGDAARAGQVAGPRTSGYVMAAMPILGLLLGTGMRASPVQVLLHSAVGNILLVAGVALVCTGLLWSDHIVSP